MASQASLHRTSHHERHHDQLLFQLAPTSAAHMPLNGMLGCRTSRSNANPRRPGGIQTLPTMLLLDGKSRLTSSPARIMLEVGGGVIVNTSLGAGVIRSGIAAYATTKHRVDAIAEELIGRLGQPEEIASAVRWLA